MRGQLQVLGLAEDLAAATDFAAALDQLKLIGEAIDVPLVTFLDDLSSSSSEVTLPEEQGERLPGNSTNFAGYGTSGNIG